jgi:hypothetical protein
MHQLVVVSNYLIFSNYKFNGPGVLGVPPLYFLLPLPLSISICLSLSVSLSAFLEVIEIGFELSPTWLVLKAPLFHAALVLASIRVHFNGNSVPVVHATAVGIPMRTLFLRG